VTALYRHVAYDLQTLQLEDSDGNIETITATDEHPFYVDGYGWVNAADLVVGQEVDGSDGKHLTVIANDDYKAVDGVVVYNFEVDGDHTYFVADGQGEESWAWVHNACVTTNRVNGLQAQSDLASRLRAAGHNVVAENVLVRTPLGRREIDIVIERGGRYYGIEAKSGDAIRGLAQRAKDAWINGMRHQGSRFFGRNARAAILSKDPAAVLHSIIAVLEL
jgi:hypothetical protein